MNTATHTEEALLPAANSKGHVPQNIIDAVEVQWHQRARAQGWEADGTEYMTQQAEFFVGAMTALTCQGYVMPVKWTVNLMSGRAACK